MSVAVLTTANVPAIAVPEAGAFRNRDCSDFRTQCQTHQTQKFFKRAHRKRGQRDAHDLDRDCNGIACEHLPKQTKRKW